MFTLSSKTKKDHHHFPSNKALDYFIFLLLLLFYRMHAFKSASIFLAGCAFELAFRLYFLHQETRGYRMKPTPPEFFCSFSSIQPVNLGYSAYALSLSPSLCNTTYFVHALYNHMKFVSRSFMIEVDPIITGPAPKARPVKTSRELRTRIFQVDPNSMRTSEYAQANSRRASSLNLNKKCDNY